MTNQMQREAFQKGFENKWMVCEDGGIYEGPSGSHSAKIGDVHVGDVICADAETFDPDNKIIWRLKEGGWIYAPVRGPKTCVMLTEKTYELTKKVTFWKVKGKKGTIVRADKAMDSDQVQIIPQDTVVHVVEEETLEDGKERMKINVPVEGWVTKSQVIRWYIEP